MSLPVEPPQAPMLAKPVSGIPTTDGLIFEPKWDGFRSIIFRDGDEVILGSRNERPLTRYFPELVEALKANLPDQCVIDGEIIVITPHMLPRTTHDGMNKATTPVDVLAHTLPHDTQDGMTTATTPVDVLESGGGLDFDALQQRIHPAASRVNLLAKETPASFVAFDMLAVGEQDLRLQPFSERRQLLEKALEQAESPIFLTPATEDRDEAIRWFNDFEGAGLDGLIAKPSMLTYQNNKRVMFKIKHERTADCVVAGFRWHKTGDIIGSMLLGMYDDAGALHHIGVTASFTMARRRELVEELAPYRVDALQGHPWESWASAAGEDGEDRENGGEAQRRPGAVSRWNAKKDLSWEPLRTELVCEVAYDHLQGDRFRHATTFRRWRTDRDPLSCTYSQLETATPMDIKTILKSY